MNKVETQKTISLWAEETFGAGGSNNVVATRANQEMAELLSAVAKDDVKKVGTEIADVFICLYRLADRMGLDVKVLVNEKMKINRERKWDVGEHGVGQHI